MVQVPLVISDAGERETRSALVSMQKQGRNIYRLQLWISV